SCFILARPHFLSSVSIFLRPLRFLPAPQQMHTKHEKSLAADVGVSQAGCRASCLLTCPALTNSVPGALTALLPDAAVRSHLSELCGGHGVVPLAAHRILNEFSSCFEAAELTRWRNAQRDQAVMATLLTGELRQILEAFDACGISAVPFKGPSLGVNYYGNA